MPFSLNLSSKFQTTTRQVLLLYIIDKSFVIQQSLDGARTRYIKESVNRDRVRRVRCPSENAKEKIYDALIGIDHLDFFLVKFYVDETY